MLRLDNLGRYAGTFQRDLQFLCDSVEFPGQSLTAVDYRIPGTKKIKVPYVRDYNEITASFYYPKEAPTYQFFSDWVTKASTRNTQNEYYDDLVGEARIIQFQEGYQFQLGTTGRISESIENQPVHLKVKLKKMYPLNFTSLSSNWGDDGFHKITVSFFFEDLEMEEFEYPIPPEKSKPESIIKDDIPIRTPGVEDFNIRVPKI